MSRLNTSYSESNLSRTSGLSDARRSKLEHLKKREELKSALTDKFKERYATGNPDRPPNESSVLSATIRMEVDKFAQTAGVTPANLNRLERRIQSRAKGQVPDNQSQISAVSLYSGLSQRSRSATSLVGRSVVSSAIPEVFDWSKLDEYASYLHEQDSLRQRVGVQALQRKLKMDLDQQVNEKQIRNSRVADEDRRHHENSMQELERWKQQEQEREAERHRKTMREKKERDEQFNYEKQLKAEEEDKRKREEGQLVQKVIDEMEAEQKRHEKKKEQTKRTMKKVFEENAADQAAKQKAQKEAETAERIRMKEYNRILDEQEQQRAEELAQRMARQAELVKKLQDTMDGGKKGGADNDVARAAAQQDEMDRHFFEAENVKQNRLKQMRLENQAYLLKQMEDKDCRKDEDKYLQTVQAQILQRDAEEYKEVERKKVSDRRAILTEHGKEIGKQMKLKAKQSVPEMSQAEIRMNKPLLSLVTKTLKARDEQLYG
eukprot:TRINITY_DN763_c1_g1_i1.p1 TRINITY_DN763_c1_g1~~TRINITY_DN763_c1_g1_i1.p1  ORF type:complete len:491 (+),score=142.70 TRINITY_DN763_c1_g1_i1:174-1646(+)